MSRYTLHPGHVFSSSDGQRHYISASDLARLYGVDMKDCEVKPVWPDQRAYGWRPWAGAIDLYPRNDGNYTLPDQRP